MSEEATLSVRQEQAFRKLTKESLEALEELHQSIIEKMKGGEAPNPEEIRFLKQFHELMEKLLAKRTKYAKDKKAVKLVGKLLRLQERYEKLGDIEAVMTKAGYYKCENCQLYHIEQDKCPFSKEEKKE